MTLAQRIDQYFGDESEALIGSMLQYGFTALEIAEATAQKLIKPTGKDESTIYKMHLYRFADGMIWGKEEMRATDRDHLAQLCGVIKPQFEEGENGEFHIYEKTRFTGSKNFVITAKKIEKK